MNDPDAVGDHERFMREAIALGRTADGITEDNPYVGCVIVRAERVLGRGYTHPPGGPHAEVAALMDARARGAAVAGATLYSTVEPCSFFGRTPPCTAAIVDGGIERVVIGIRDPHPRVNGEGVRLLRAAGIDVIEDVLAAEVRAYLARWLRSHGVG